MRNALKTFTSWTPLNLLRSTSRVLCIQNSIPIGYLPFVFSSTRRIRAIGPICVWRKYSDFPALHLPTHCQAGSREKVAALGLLRRYPRPPLLPLPRPAAGLRNSSFGCLAGSARLDQHGYNDGECRACFYPVYCSRLSQVLDRFGIRRPLLNAQNTMIPLDSVAAQYRHPS